jgi:hypothetical protein
MTWKTVEEMSAAEVVSTAESLASYAESCREIQQGINTKEVVRFNKCMTRIEGEKLESPAYIIELRRRWNPDFAADPVHRQMLTRLFENGCTLEGMSKLFAPL